MCFTLEWLRDLFIWLIVIGAIIAIVRILLPMVLSLIGAPAGTIMQIVNIALWAFIAVMIVVFAFDLIGCIGHIGGFPRLGGG